MIDLEKNDRRRSNVQGKNFTRHYAGNKKIRRVKIITIQFFHPGPKFQKRCKLTGTVVAGVKYDFVEACRII